MDHFAKVDSTIVATLAVWLSGKNRHPGLVSMTLRSLDGTTTTYNVPGGAGLAFKRMYGMANHSIRANSPFVSKAPCYIQLHGLLYPQLYMRMPPVDGDGDGELVASKIWRMRDGERTRVASRPISLRCGDVIQFDDGKLDLTVTSTNLNLNKLGERLQWLVEVVRSSFLTSFVYVFTTVINSSRFGYLFLVLSTAIIAMHVFATLCWYRR